MTEISQKVTDNQEQLEEVANRLYDLVNKLSTVSSCTDNNTADLSNVNQKINDNQDAIAELSTSVCNLVKKLSEA